jgi:HlyD family secretion protein
MLYKRICCSFYRTILMTSLVVVIFSLGCEREASDEFSVMSGYFRQSVIETGELEAVKSSSIVMPTIKWEYGYSYKIIGLIEHGSIVTEGDSVAALDPSSVHRYIIQKEEALENEMAAENKQMVQMENTIQELQAQLRSELATYNLKKLELDRMQFESETKRKIKELEFQQATIRFENVKLNLESKSRQEEIDLSMYRIKVLQREAEIRDAKEALNKLTIYSPNNGVFQVNRNRWNGQLVRLGDNMYFGSLIASIPDLRAMKVLSHINETDISKVKTGMKVIVRLDALPEVPFNGVVTSVSKISTVRDEKNVFLTQVEILESDIRLKPGMTVSCEYICHEEENALFVHNSCLLNQDGQTWVFPAAGSKMERIKVNTGHSNNHHTLIIDSELEPGQKLMPVGLTDFGKTL